MLDNVTHKHIHKRNNVALICFDDFLLLVNVYLFLFDNFFMFTQLLELVLHLQKRTFVFFDFHSVEFEFFFCAAPLVSVEKKKNHSSIAPPNVFRLVPPLPASWSLSGGWLCLIILLSCSFLLQYALKLYVTYLIVNMQYLLIK